MPRSSLTRPVGPSPAHTLLYPVVLILLPMSVAAQNAARSRDEAAIRTVVAEQVNAWNAGDAKAFSASFAEDGSFTNIRGSVYYGHRAFEDRHADIFRTFFYGSRLAMSPTRINFVRPDVAIVDISTEVSELKGRPPPGIRPKADGKLHTRLQRVMVKDGNRRIINFSSFERVVEFVRVEGDLVFRLAPLHAPRQRNRGLTCDFSVALRSCSLLPALEGRRRQGRTRSAGRWLWMRNIRLGSSRRSGPSRLRIASVRRHAMALMDRARQTNRLLQREVARDSLHTYVDVFTPMLDRAGQPRPELFLEDSLHLTRAGYQLWRKHLLPVVY